MRRSPRAISTSLCLLVCIFVFACKGSNNPPNTPPSNPADFSLSVSPATVSLTAGGAGVPFTLNAAAINGFSGQVTVALSGLPDGVVAQPANAVLAPGIAQTITLTAAASAAAANATLTLTGTSGSLTHTATIGITVAPQAVADFSLSVSPTSLSITNAKPGAVVSLTATAINAFTSPVAVAITGLPAGVTASPASLTLTAGTAQSITLTAAAGTPPAMPTITFTGTAASLTHTATVALTVLANSPDIVTYHDDISRDGLNAQETILTQANVNSTQFGLIATPTLDGKVDAQPLFLANVMLNGQLHNVLYVATEQGSLYALDADTGTQLWKTSTLGSGETTSDDHGCDQITPVIGITSTPVIDRKLGPNGTIFVVAMSRDAQLAYHQRLHAIDITTGAEIKGSPTEITATYPGGGDNSSHGNVVFEPGQYAERAGLLLVNGTIYTGWTSHCDIRPYTGWIMGYSESSLQQMQVLNVTPNGSEGSVWMSGNGIAADSDGNLYLLDANGTFDPTLDANGFPADGDFGNAMLKLSTNGKLAVADYFETFNTELESSEDIDLGSGGEVLLPDMTDAAGKVRHLVVGAGKDRTIYLADRDNMGKFNANTAPSNANIYQQVKGQLADMVFSTPAYFNGVLYYGARTDNLKAFPFTDARLAKTPSSQTSVAFPKPGTTPAISANGVTDGIVWALESSLTAPAILHAYDPANLAHEFYNSSQAANGRDGFGNGNKFIAPLVVNGKVYAGTQTGVAIFGLLK